MAHGMHRIHKIVTLTAQRVLVTPWETASYYTAQTHDKSQVAPGPHIAPRHPAYILAT